MKLIGAKWTWESKLIKKMYIFNSAAHQKIKIPTKKKPKDNLRIYLKQIEIYQVEIKDFLTSINNERLRINWAEPIRKK